MRRSEINGILRDGAAFIAGLGWHLPPFADWTPEALRARTDSDVVARRLGWDVSDYGSGAFAATGLMLFTLRNGRLADLSAGRGMLYAEKLLISRKDQWAPMHRHAVKAEDIINRGGGRLVLELYASARDGSIDRAARIVVPCDGLPVSLQAGGHLALDPGQSVTLLPGVWHGFRAEGGDCLIGEVSTVNDDETDNIFADPIPRFPTVTEDEPPWRLLVSDYPAVQTA